MVYNKELVSICIPNNNTPDVIYNILGSMNSQNFNKIEGDELFEYLKNDPNQCRFRDKYDIYVNPNLESKPKINEVEAYEGHRINFYDVDAKYRIKIDKIEEIRNSFPMIKIEKIGTFYGDNFLIKLY